MIINNPQDFKLVRFEKSKTSFKKYDAILMNKKTGMLQRVPFGDNRYPQYKDKVPLGLYRKSDHNDKERRRRYRLRHAGEDKNKFSSGYFSWKYLW